MTGIELFINLMVKFMENVPEEPEMLELKLNLLALRDSLVNASQSLRDLQCLVDLKGQKVARESVEEILSRFTNH